MVGRGWSGDRQAQTAVVGTVLIIALLVAMGSVAFLQSRSVEDASVLSYEPDAVRIADEDGRYAIQYLAGRGIDRAEGLIIADVDGERHEIPLDWYGSQAWEVGEILCVVGPGPSCPIPTGQDVEVTLIVNGQVLASREFSSRTFRILPSGAVELLCGGDLAVRVVGSALTSGSGTAPADVTVDLTRDGGQSLEPLFGGAGVEGGERFEMLRVAPGALFGIQGSADGAHTRNSYSSDVFVRTLVDEDAVPDVPGFAGQGAIADFLEPLVGDQRIEIARNEALVLLELGVNDLEDEAADFQDLVVIFELPTECV